MHDLFLDEVQRIYRMLGYELLIGGELAAAQRGRRLVSASVDRWPVFAYAHLGLGDSADLYFKALVDNPGDFAFRVSDRDLPDALGPAGLLLPGLTQDDADVEARFLSQTNDSARFARSFAEVSMRSLLETAGHLDFTLGPSCAGDFGAAGEGQTLPRGIAELCLHVRGPCERLSWLLAAHDAFAQLLPRVSRSAVADASDTEYLRRRIDWTHSVRVATDEVWFDGPGLRRRIVHELAKQPRDERTLLALARLLDDPHPRVVGSALTVLASTRFEPDYRLEGASENTVPIAQAVASALHGLGPLSTASANRRMEMVMQRCGFGPHKRVFDDVLRGEDADIELLDSELRTGVIQSLLQVVARAPDSTQVAHAAKTLASLNVGAALAVLNKRAFRAGREASVRLSGALLAHAEQIEQVSREFAAPAPDLRQRIQPEWDGVCARCGLDDGAPGTWGMFRATRDLHHGVRPLRMGVFARPRRFVTLDDVTGDVFIKAVFLNDREATFSLLDHASPSANAHGQSVWLGDDAADAQFSAVTSHVEWFRQLFESARMIELAYIPATVDFAVSDREWRVQRRDGRNATLSELVLWLHGPLLDLRHLDVAIGVFERTLRALHGPPLTDHIDTLQKLIQETPRHRIELDQLTWWDGEEICLDAAMQLGRIAGSSAAQVLIESLDDSSPRIREEAATALDARRHADAHDVVLHAFIDHYWVRPDAPVHRALARYLESAGSADVVATLEAIMGGAPLPECETSHARLRAALESPLNHLVQAAPPVHCARAAAGLVQLGIASDDALASVRFALELYEEGVVYARLQRALEGIESLRRLPQPTEQPESRDQLPKATTGQVSRKDLPRSSKK